MPRAIHVFRTPDRFVAGTVGEPGDRSFYLQAVHDARVVSVALEKQQVQVLADRVGLLLDEVARRFGTDVPPEEADPSDVDPLVMPVDAEFRVGTMGLGWDADAGAVVVELLAITETEIDESVVLDDTDEGPDAVRVFLSPSRPVSSPRAASASSLPVGPRARSAGSPSRPVVTCACGPTGTGAAPCWEATPPSSGTSPDLRRRRHRALDRRRHGPARARRDDHRRSRGAGVQRDARVRDRA